MSTGQPQQFQKRPYRRKATATQSTGLPNSGDSSGSGPSLSKTTDPLDERTARKRDIGKTISEAMAKLNDVDWSRESPAINEALDAMQESMALYVEEKVSKVEVRSAYKNYVNALREGLFG